MKVVLYTRVSTDEQAKEGSSLKVQREYLLDYVERENARKDKPEKEKWEIHYADPVKKKIFEDDGHSGYSTERPALKQLLAEAKKKKFDLILCYKLDRFSRNLKDTLNITAQLDEWKIGLKSATEPFDTTSSAGRLLFQQLGSFAEFERNRLKERVFPGMIESVKAGNWHGARYSPYGYRYDKKKKLLEIIPEEAKVVKLIYFMYISGQSTRQIAGYLYEKGYKTRSGGRFQTKLVCDILKNQIYLGKIVWNKRHYDTSKKTLKGYKYVRNDPSKVIVAQGIHQAIIPQEDFDAAQKRLEHARKGVVRRHNAREYLLTGILMCAKCGHKFQGCVSTASRENGKTKEKRRYYRCSGPLAYGVKCGNSYAKADELEYAAYKILEFTFSNPDISESRLIGIVSSTADVHDEDLEQEIASLKAKLDGNLARQERLSSAYSEGLLGKEIFRKQILPLRDEEKAQRSELRKLELRLVERERSVEYQKLLCAVLAHIESFKHENDLPAKKGLLKLVFKSILLDNGKVKDFELYKPFQALYEGARHEGLIQQLFEGEEITACKGNVSTWCLMAAR